MEPQGDCSPPGADLCTVCLIAMTRTAELARLAVALAGHQPPLLSGRGGDDIALLAVRLQRG